MEKTNPSERKLRFEDYLAGGCLANVPLWTLTFVFSYLEVEKIPQTLLDFVFLITTALSGILSGYILARKVNFNYEKVGFKTGISAFLVNFAFSSLVLASTSGAAWTFLALCTGGTVGGFLAHMSRE